MTVFLWVIVISMAVALLMEVLALVGMVLVPMRAARRVQAIQEELTQKFQPTIRMAEELKESLQTHADTVTADGKKVAAVVVNRLRTIEAVGGDISRRAERIRIRLNSERIQTVEQMRQGRQIQRQIVEPIQVASQVLRGIRAALWLLRKVA